MHRSLKIFIVGLLLGIGTAAVIPAFAVAPENGPQTSLIGAINKIINNYCNVYVGNGHISPSRMCRGDEVMVGFSGEYINCAEVIVQCFSEQPVQAPPH